MSNATARPYANVSTVPIPFVPLPPFVAPNKRTATNAGLPTVNPAADALPVTLPPSATRLMPRSSTESPTGTAAAFNSFNPSVTRTPLNLGGNFPSVLELPANLTANAAQGVPGYAAPYSNNRAWNGAYQGTPSPNFDMLGSIGGLSDMSTVSGDWRGVPFSTNSEIPVVSAASAVGGQGIDWLNQTPLNTPNGIAAGDMSFLNNMDNNAPRFDMSGGPAQSNMQGLRFESGGGIDSGFDLAKSWNKHGAMITGGIEAIGNIANAYTGIKTLGQNKDMMNFQKEAWTKGYELQRRSINDQLEQRQLYRNKAQPGQFQDAAEYMKERGV